MKALSLDTADELAIRNLLARYGDAVCRRDPAAWIATWATDCTWDLGGGRVTHGRDETFALWRTLDRQVPVGRPAARVRARSG